MGSSTTSTTGSSTTGSGCFTGFLDFGLTGSTSLREVSSSLLRKLGAVLISQTIFLVVISLILNFLSAPYDIATTPTFPKLVSLSETGRVNYRTERFVLLFNDSSLNALDKNEKILYLLNFLFRPCSSSNKKQIKPDAIGSNLPI